jgi:DNA-binding transcriptional MocR family regulator
MADRIARHLAAVMHVNTNTVLRALRLLRDEGLLELRPSHGIRVSGTPQRGALLAKAIELVQLSRESSPIRRRRVAVGEWRMLAGKTARRACAPTRSTRTLRLGRGGL